MFGRIIKDIRKVGFGNRNAIFYDKVQEIWQEVQRGL